MTEMLNKYPLAFGQWLVALDTALAVPVEVAIIGDPTAADTLLLLDVVREGYHPHQLLAAGTGRYPPLLEHRQQVDGIATAYVCKNQVCQPSVSLQEKLRELLRSH